MKKGKLSKIELYYIEGHRADGAKRIASELDRSEKTIQAALDALPAPPPPPEPPAPPPPPNRAEAMRNRMRLEDTVNVGPDRKPRKVGMVMTQEGAESRNKKGGIPSRTRDATAKIYKD
jgi:hypothetical protein